VPRLFALHLGERYIADIAERAVGRIGPRHAIHEKAHDLPLRKQRLDLFRVRQLLRPKNQPFGSALNDHAEMISMTESTSG
jgi:hypothetical protein